MKPFDLEAFKQGEVGILRCGDEVTFVAHVPEAQEFYRLVYMDAKRYIESCSEEGRYLQAGEGEIDIIGLKSQTLVVWLNLYPQDSITHKMAYGYASCEEAEACSGQDRRNNKPCRVEIEL